MFDIIVSPKEAHKDTARGVFVVGDFRETIEIDLSYWSIQHYRESWLRVANRIIDVGFGRFLTSVGARSSDFLWTWPCWKRNGQVIVRNQILRLSLHAISNPESAEAYDNEYRAYGVEGERISEWRCDLAEIVDFAKRLSGMVA